MPGRLCRLCRGACCWTYCRIDTKQTRHINAMGKRKDDDGFNLALESFLEIDEDSKEVER